MTSVIEQKILDAIAVVKSQGYTLVDQDWGSPTLKCGCPMSCLIIANVPEDKAKEIIDRDDQAKLVAAQLLEVSRDWISSFIIGFDKSKINKETNIQEAYDLGNKIWCQTNPIDYYIYLQSIDDYSFNKLYKGEDS